MNNADAAAGDRPRPFGDPARNVDAEITGKSFPISVLSKRFEVRRLYAASFRRIFGFTRKPPFSGFIGFALPFETSGRADGCRVFL
jgi:hypothetical protein